MTLKRCPFCNDQPLSLWVGNSTPGMEDCGYWSVGCPGCATGTPPRIVEVHAESQPDAEARWNDRAALTEGGATIPVPREDLAAACCAVNRDRWACSREGDAAGEAAMAALHDRLSLLYIAHPSPQTPPAKKGPDYCRHCCWEDECQEAGECLIAMKVKP